jgi:hypothetical protein
VFGVLVLWAHLVMVVLRLERQEILGVLVFRALEWGLVPGVQRLVLVRVLLVQVGLELGRH